MISTVLLLLLQWILATHTSMFAPSFPVFPDIDEHDLASSSVLISKPLFSYSQRPVVSAQSAIVIDGNSGEFLYTKNISAQLFPASTTKMMTALLVLEEMALENTASISASIVHEGSVMGLLPGEHIVVRDLLHGMLIASANDAADQLSDMYPGGKRSFIRRMNERAQELGLSQTHFQNPMGFYDPVHKTTVRDLAMLTKFIMRNDIFRTIVQTQKETVSSTDGKIVHSLESTNELLGKYEGIEGVKTGWTQEAGECFVARATRGNAQRIVVVLHSGDRFQDARKLLDWSFTSFQTIAQPIWE